MTLTQLKYVYETAKAGSISLAAERCFTAQSVLSTSIRKLEEEIGYQIFIRSRRGVTLTPFGKTFVDYLIPMLEHARMLDNLIDHKKDSMQSLRVASSGWSLVSCAISEIMHSDKWKQVKVAYYEMLDHEVMQMVSERSAEIGFIRRYSCYRHQNLDSCRSLGLRFEKLFQARLGVTVSSANPLFYLKEDVVDPEILKDCTMIVWNYTDEVLFQDLKKRLHLPDSSRCVIVNARAAVDDILHHSPSYYLNTMLPNCFPEKPYENGPQERTLLLKNCSITSEFGWIRRKDTELTELSTTLLDVIRDNLQSRADSQKEKC